MQGGGAAVRLAEGKVAQGDGGARKPAAADLRIKAHAAAAAFDALVEQGLDFGRIKHLIKRSVEAKRQQQHGEAAEDNQFEPEFARMQKARQHNGNTQNNSGQV